MSTGGGTDLPVPPRFAGWIVSLRVPAEEREYVLGDLAEGYVARHQLLGSWRARFWYWTQAASIVTSSRHGPINANPAGRRERSMVSIWADLRCALRTLVRAPLFALLVILTLAVGIGATSALFSVVYPVLLAAPPYPDPDRLVMVSERTEDGEDAGIGWLTFDDTRRETRVFSSMAAMSYWMPTLQAGDDVVRLNGQRVSHTFFRTLGVRPALGRDFTPEEDHIETRRVVILSDGLWRRQFGADPSIVGRATLINGTATLVAGVMPRDFQSLLQPEAEVWAPLGYDANYDSACRTCHHLRVIARIREGITLARVRERLDAFFAILRERHPDQYGTVGALVRTLQDEVAGDVRASLLGLFAAVGLLLLLACANVANLLLGRTGQRQTELSVRMALGAERSRLIRLVSLEALVLAMAGGALGIIGAWAGTRLLVEFLQIPPALATRVSTATPVIFFALLMATLSALVAGTLPALLSLKESALTDIRAGTRNVVRAVRHRLRNVVVVAEVALALALLVGAGLQVRSLQHSLNVTTGYRAAGVLTMELGVSGPRYSEDGAARRYFHQFLEQSDGIAGVESIAIVSQLPLGGNFDATAVHREDKPSLNPENVPSAQRFEVSWQYLDAMSIPVFRGRGFTAADRAGAEPVVIFNEAAVRTIFGSEDPVGRRVRVGGSDSPWRRVIGVVGDVRHLSLERPIESQFYTPYDQTVYEGMDYVVVARTSGEPATFGVALTRVAKALDPGAVVARVRPMQDVVNTATQSRRLASTLIGAFAMIALLLASGGLYGVMSAGVAERAREMGLRGALGASPTSIVRLVVARGFVLTVAGSVLGGVGVMAAQGLLRQFVFGVTPADPITLISVAALLAAVAMIACAVPAWRAAHIDPATSLRE